MRLPQDAYRWNRAHRGAFKKGILAFHAGVSKEDCPYGDKRNTTGRINWNRSFRSAWRDGWWWASKGRDLDDTRG